MPRTHHRSLLTAVSSLLLALASLIASLSHPLTPAQAQVSNGGGFASAVPCLSGTPAFATTMLANTIYTGAPTASAAAPALVQITSASRTLLAPLGASSVPGQNSPVVNGVGSTYGLAYDDGSVSGIRRLFAAAYVKRTVGLSTAGPGAIYEYRFATGAWSLAATVAGVGGTARVAGDTVDGAVFDQVGKVGLGDLEVAPDGRTLYAMNLASRQIARFDISGGAPVAQAAISIPFGLISGSAAVQADLRPFALGVYPIASLSGGSRFNLVVGVVDSAQRSATGDASPWTFPKAYVLGYNTGSGGWGLALSQDLHSAALQNREVGSTFLPDTPPPGFAQTASWNPWRASRADLLQTTSVRAPQPLLTDITFSQDGQRMYVGLRDRSGDQLFGANPPAGEASVLAQGDVLTYRLAGGAWQLQGDSVDDVFDDNSHVYAGPTPAHIENLMGAMGISMGGSGPASFSEQLLGTALLGGSASGTRTYAGGGGITSQQTLNAASSVASGKASSLGDVEVLCSYALVGGQVWKDIDNDGIQDAGEPGFPNVALDVFSGSSASDPALASLTTDAQGGYLFAVPPNTPVNIRIAAGSRSTLAAQGWRLTDANQGASDTADSDASPIYGYIELAGQNYGTVGGGLTGIAVPMPLNRGEQRDLDLGVTQVQPVGQIGDRVWDDTNHNGIQNSGEPGHAGIAATLSPDPQTMALLPGMYPRVNTSDASGSYLFPNLPSGRYAVTFSVPPAPFGATLRNQGGNDTLDSDGDASTGYRSPLITIDGTTDRSIDFGLYGGTPDLWVNKSGPAQMLVGQQFSYTLDYGNQGALAAAGAQLRDTLPAGLAYVSASPAPSSVSGQVITWNLGSLAAGATGQIVLVARAPASLGAATSLAVTNSATISTTTPNDPPGNDTDTSTGTVVRPEVGITKTAPATALVGDEFTYSLGYANTGSIAAATVSIGDSLPAGVTLSRFIQNPGAACAYTAATRRISCSFASLGAGASGSVIFAARADVTAAASVANTATISTATAGDDPANNTSTATTAIQLPNPGVTVGITPSPFPVGASGSITASYRNTGTGLARSTTLSLTMPAGVSLGILPGGCVYTAATRLLACALGDLAAGAAGARVIPLSLPATFAADNLSVAATIATLTPERPADLADNTASASVSVVRPNVFVTASGPASIVGQGSVFWYTVDYGNQYRASPSLTRAAASVVLTATLPPDVTLVQADVTPTSVSGQVLSWDLGTLAPNAGGQIHIVVQTKVPAGATLHFTADIRTITPGDNLADNHAAVDTDVVPPPAEVAQGQGDLRVAIHSDLDPNSQDANPTNGVYVSDSSRIAWPTGEVLDFTPRLSGLSFPDEPLPFPYEYRARVVGWSVAGFTVNNVAHDPQAADSRGVAGCRAGARPTIVPQRLTGCSYAYLGGASRSAIERPSAITEAELATQAHAYWTQPPAPRMRSDVYLYTLDPLRSVQFAVQVEVEVWIVNAAPGAINGVPLPEIPVVPLPDPARQLITQDFDVTLLIPRSLIGPGSR